MMTVNDILDTVEYNYNLDEVNPLDFNYYKYLTTKEYNCLINKYKEYEKQYENRMEMIKKNSEAKKIHDFLYMNSYIIYRAIYLRRYQTSFYGIKLAGNTYDSDILQEFPFVFYKVIDKYVDIGDASSYSSYINYWYRYVMTELIRVKYFQVMKVSQKASRAKETRVYKQELMDDSSIDFLIEDSLINELDSRLSDLLKQIKIMIQRKYFSIDEYIMFLKYNRMYGSCRKYTLAELGAEYGIDTINKVHYKINRVVVACKKNYLFKKRNEERYK